MPFLPVMTVGPRQDEPASQRHSHLFLLLLLPNRFSIQWLILWEFRILHFDPIHSILPTPPRSPSLFPMYSTLCPHFFKFIENSQCHLSTRGAWVSGRSLKQGWPCRGHPPAETCFSPDGGPQWSKHKKPGDYKMFSLTWDSYITPPPLKHGSGNHCRKRTKGCESQRCGCLQNPVFPVTAGHLHGLIAVMECMFRPDKIPA